MNQMMITEKRPEFIGLPGTEHHPSTRGMTGIPSLAVSKGGRMWTTWYAGLNPAEDESNYCVLSTSSDGGKTWKEICIVDPDGDGPRRTFDPELWIGPDGCLRWFWCDRAGTGSSGMNTDILWMMEIGDPEQVPLNAFPEPRVIGSGVMMNKPIVLRDGTWALPVSKWFAEKSSEMLISQDNGKTFYMRGAADIPQEVRTFDEHHFVELKNGHIWCLARTKSGIHEGVSKDGGVTWPQLRPSPIHHVSSRFFICRLTSGNLLLVKHGPINVQAAKREQLMAFLSENDGQSWKGGLLLDERAGVSYPDGHQAADGTLFIVYDFDRFATGQILFASFTEADVLAGSDVSGRIRLRNVIARKPSHPGLFRLAQK